MLRGVSEVTTYARSVSDDAEERRIEREEASRSREERERRAEERQEEKERFAEERRSAHDKNQALLQLAMIRALSGIKDFIL